MQKEDVQQTNTSPRGQDIQHRTFSFAVTIIKICVLLDQKPGVSRTLSRQLLRSATSIGANVEEAQAGQSKADFISKMSIALKEARETHYWLRLLQSAEITTSDSLTELQNESEQIKKVIGAIIVSARRS